MERIMILGAGRTGRGFIGRLAAEAGMPVTFVDKDAELVEKLRKAKDDGGFTVRFYGDEREPLKITDYIAEIPTEKIDFSGISLIMVSVGGAHLTEAGMWLKKVLPTNRLLYVIACENAAEPAETLEKTIGLPNVMVSEAAVFCTCNSEGIDILSENYPDLPFDRKRLIGFTAPVPGFKEELSFGNLLQRKIFTYNAASAVIAYMGWLYGFSDYAEAWIRTMQPPTGPSVKNSATTPKSRKPLPSCREKSLRIRPLSIPSPETRENPRENWDRRNASSDRSVF